MSDDEKLVPFRARAKGGCPLCGRPAVERYRPFCSKRCADLDLHRWFSEGYRVPTEETPETEETPDPKRETEEE